MRSTRLRGARTHNLQNVDLDLQPGTLIVVAGPSGAGKSSLAFGTLYAEGQRRYVESFSAYARQFLERLARPPVDELEPVPAAIAVDRESPVKTSRSTVGTMTEITDYAKSLWARAATLSCPDCGRDVTRDNAVDAASRVLEGSPDARLTVTYPVPVATPEAFVGVRETLLADGYRRVRVHGEVRDLDVVKPSDVFGTAVVAKKVAKSPKAKGKTPKAKAAATAQEVTATIDVVADRTTSRADDRGRLVEALEAALMRGQGRADVLVEGDDTKAAPRYRFSGALHCAFCDKSFRDASPGTFSFNTPIGACEACRGFGRVIGVDWERVIPDKTKTLAGGAVKAWSGNAAQWEREYLMRMAKRAGVPTDVPYAQLSAAHQKWLIEGEGPKWKSEWAGLRRWFDWMESRAYKMHVRVFLSRYRKYETCGACDGSRLKGEARHWKIGGKNISEFYAMQVSDALAFIETQRGKLEADPALLLVVRECEARLRTLVEVGLGYLTLERASRTLSGGEAQRVALTGALGASLTGAMFVLDEPTVGLHPSDVTKLFDVVTRLRDGGNIVLVVEHDETFVRGADRVLELGPGAGEKGGRIVFDGDPRALALGSTATGRALATGKKVTRPRRAGSGWLTLRGASGNNLQSVDLEVPLGALTCITGVSGSGKSTLVLDTFYPAVARARGKTAPEPLPFTSLAGHAPLTDVIHVDQASLGRTSRGNPATYLKAWDVIRRRFSAEKLAKSRGYGPGAFSFNVPGGRCEACKGEGAETVEMQFLADVTFECPECKGERFIGPVLDVRVNGKNVAEVLAMTADEALAWLPDEKDLAARLAALVDVGAGYLRLGQPLSTLSGGEAQRLKLAEALAGAQPGALVVLDEPTAGLHASDVTPLLDVLDRLVARGDTVVVVEHDMRVAAFADHVIDLGPGAGTDGGRIVAKGTPEQVAVSKTGSRTAPFLHAELRGEEPAARKTRGAARGDDDVAELEAISVRGAREHNLQNVSLSIPREKLVVVTGPSGSGKSTLAFDVIHAEAQRRYIETLSPYARQYLPQLPRPAVDRVRGLPPSVSLEQRVTRGGANSTVATVTEIAHYARLLWARAGLLHCPDCKVPIAPRQPAALAQDVRGQVTAKAELEVLAPVVRGRKGHHGEILDRAFKDGFRRARIDGKDVELERGMRLARFKEHEVALVVGAVKANDAKLEELITRASALGDGTVHVRGGGMDMMLSTKRACSKCGRGFPELDPRFFSFNTRQGACETCEGKGYTEREVGRGKSAYILLEECTACDGTRLSALARAVTFLDKPISDLMRLPVSDARREVSGWKLTGREGAIAKAPLQELSARLAFLDDVGLGYLGLDRAADTLSGGETQRVRLAAQLGAGLTGVLYVLDEPTIGLHPRDTGRLLRALRTLVDKGCSVLVVEHDADTIRAADHLVDVGPSGGRHGGHVVASGPAREVLASETSVTARALAAPPPLEGGRRTVDASTPWIEVVGAREHNLREVTLRIPHGRLVSVTGVSGSGKSTLVRDVLLRGARRALDLVADEPGEHTSIRGLAPITRAIEIDQSPIGRTPRSVPATYIGIWDELRKLLASTPEARARGYDPSRFSFNVAKGRCPACEGQGATSVEMAFLPEVLVPCEQCGGARFTPETLFPTLHGLSAAKLLDLDVADAAELLAPFSKVAKPLRLLADLGLGYLRLGQASNTLSGGEAQRMKLVAELAGAQSGRTLYVMDEPTTGLHRDDVGRLVHVLDRLVERGDTVVVIEHHPDVMLASDWIIDLGPEGGADGGRIIAEGTPTQVAKVKGSHTGKVLAEELKARPAATRSTTRTSRDSTAARGRHGQRQQAGTP